MTATVSEKGKLRLPAELYKRDHILEGQEFKITRLKSGVYRLTRIKKKRKPNEGLVDWLLQCPVKGFFVPFDRSETTDTL